MSELLQGVNGADLPLMTGKSQPATACLPLITLFQYMEQITDSQVNDAIRLRLDWRYALHLPQYTRGAEVNTALYCQYRQQVLADPILQGEIQLVYQRLEALGLWKNCLFGHPAVPAVLSSVCTISRAALARQALAQAIEALAARDPEWLRTIILPRWYSAYLYPRRPAPGPNSCPTTHPDAQPDETRLIEADMVYLLQVCREKDALGFEALPEIIQLQHVLEEQYTLHQGTLHQGAQPGASFARGHTYACSSCQSQALQSW